MNTAYEDGLVYMLAGKLEFGSVRKSSWLLATAETLHTQELLVFHSGGMYVYRWDSKSSFTVWDNNYSSLATVEEFGVATEPMMAPSRTWECAKRAKKFIYANDWL